MPIGIDILKISRLEKNVSNERFLKKLFSEKEIEYFKKRRYKTETVAANFCAKEALAKATGLGLSRLPLTEISLLRDDFGRPYFEFSQNAKNNLGVRFAEEIYVTVSHDNDMATAVVFIGRDAKYEEFAVASAKSDVGDEGIISLKTAKKLLPKRPADSHKGDFGKVLAIAGSTGFTGAARLACEAMLKCGSGLITLGCPKSLNEIFEISLKEIMTCPLKDRKGILSRRAIPEILKLLNGRDVCLVGCGMSLTYDTMLITEKIIKEFDKPVVIDADGINALAMNINILKNHRQDIILTPHLAEFARLIGKETDYAVKNGVSCAVRFAREYNVYIVLKSHRTKVIFPDGRVFENVLGNSGMATGGSGDVLAGIITSLTGQKIPVQNAVLLGVYIHSLAADIASLSLGEYSLTPTDIVNSLACVFKYLGG